MTTTTDAVVPVKTLTCSTCPETFEHPVSRGRYPSRCPSCRPARTASARPARSRPPVRKPKPTAATTARGARRNQAPAAAEARPAEALERPERTVATLRDQLARAEANAAEAHRRAERSERDLAGARRELDQVAAAKSAAETSAAEARESAERHKNASDEMRERLVQARNEARAQRERADAAERRTITADAVESASATDDDRAIAEIVVSGTSQAEQALKSLRQVTETLVGAAMPFRQFCDMRIENPRQPATVVELRVPGAAHSALCTAIDDVHTWRVDQASGRALTPLAEAA